MVAMGLRHRRHDRVRDGHLPQRRCRRRPAGHRPGTITAGGRPPPGHLLGLPQGLPVAGLHRRRGPVVVLCSYPAVFPAGRGRSPRGARRLVRRVDRADRGAVPGAPRAGGHHAGHRRPPATPPGRWQRAFTDIDAHRILQASDAAKGLLHPAAAKVIATLSNEWDGLARHQELPQLPLDNYPDVAVMPRFRAGRGCFRWPGRWPGRVVRHNHRASRNASSSSLAVYRPRRVRGGAVRSSARCLSSRSA